MVGIIFAVLCVGSVVFAVITGSGAELSNAVFDGASGAVQLTLSLCGIMCLWCGCMNVLEKKGVIKQMARLLSPLLRLVFPQAFRTGVGRGEIASNVSANILGIGNAATPLGLRAMAALQSVNPNKERASDDMVMLVVLNTASLDLLPTTLIALRRASGSARPYAVILPTLIASLCTTVFAVVITRLFARVSK